VATEGDVVVYAPTTDMSQLAGDYPAELATLLRLSMESRGREARGAEFAGVLKFKNTFQIRWGNVYLSPRVFVACFKRNYNLFLSFVNYFLIHFIQWVFNLGKRQDRTISNILKMSVNGIKPRHFVSWH
jgi:hypothetical protein